jgi:hypothetical protein
LSDPSHPELSALWAVLVHGLLSVVVLPLVLTSTRPFRFAGLAFAAGVALDIDHVVVAHSVNPRALEHLAGRPATHSLVFATGLALVALGLTHRPRLAWAVFAIVAIHVIFDAAGGGERWLFPFAQVDGLPWLACPAGLLILASISAVLAWEPRSLPDAHPVDQHARRELRGSVG